jgi:catalase
MSKKKIAAKEVPTKTENLSGDTVVADEHLTTNQGLRISDDQNSLKAGVRGPTLLEDFHFREKITHFDHERIPERVVHARGAAAHGYFQPHKGAGKFCKAAMFQDPAKQTPVFLRFSTVAGSRGSADTARDVRGFAVKFYTEEGVWDLVGNDIPIFFIQDAIKFPDLIHAVKPEPQNEIPQAQSAHDTFYDFVSLTPESTAMLMWVMSDRGIPRSFSTVEGFGIHTFRMIDAKGVSRFVKFHFKPVKGVHSLIWDEAQKIAGKDPDFHRRDLFDSIETGDFPEWEMGVQIVEEKDELKFDFDILDATKIIPEELVPITPLGKLVLNRNPDNYFAETEQVAFHLGHVVPGIDFSNDPLLQGRLFSYLDTQLKRVGPNFAQLPINRPTCPFSNNQRDGEAQQLIHKGTVAYFPNSIGGGCPAHSPEAMQAFTSYAEKIDGTKVRMRSPSFSDHFSQATLFWNSMADWEKDHIVKAFSFELNQCKNEAIKARVVNDLLLNVAAELATKVATNIGVKIAAKPRVKSHDRKSAALSMDKPAPNLKGRKVAILAGDSVDAKQVSRLKSALADEGAVAEIVAKLPGIITGSDGKAIPVDRVAANAPSVIYDAVFIPSGSAAAVAQLGVAVHFVTEAYVHGKAIAAGGDGVEVLRKAHIPFEENRSALGVAVGKDAGKLVAEFLTSMHKRHYDRDVESLPA